MASRVKINFVRSHRWHHRGTFLVHHSEGPSLLSQLTEECGARKPLWPTPWEQAGFGHGQFALGSFGWGQGSIDSGGFGFGRFGSGEFGYYNAIVTWISPRAYRDGLHTFCIKVFQACGLAGESIREWPFLITSIPSPPKALRFAGMTGGELTLRWIDSDDI
jgi:hypothetical protein